MLTKSGPKLLDFGLAQTQLAASLAPESEAPTQAASLTGEGRIIGTLQYMAPEQVEGRHIWRCPALGSIAGFADESGKYQIYVQSYPTPGNKKPVSADVGLYPKWRRDGMEQYFLIYRGLESTLMVSTVTSTGSTIAFSLPRALFPAPLTSDNWINDQYSPSPNGNRFLFNALVESAAPPAINVVLNWKRPPPGPPAFALMSSVSRATARQANSLL